MVNLLTGWTFLAVEAALTLGLWAFHEGDSMPARRPWCGAAVGLAVTVALLDAGAVLSDAAPDVLLDQVSVWWLAALGAAVVVWRRSRESSTAVKAERYGGLALLCLTAVVLRVWLVVGLLVTRSWDGWSPWLTGALLVQLMTAAGIGLAAAGAASRQARTLPVPS
jgi:hypothetical protein